MITLLRTFALFLIITLTASTTDLNGQWVQQPFPTNEFLHKVRFVDESTGWVLGHDYIYKTTDGGMTWVQQDPTLGGGDMQECLNRGLIVMAYNPDIRINPPLIITQEIAEEGIDIMEEAFAHVADRINL